jgi:hypothetical protein
MKIKILATDEHGQTRTKHDIFIISERGRDSETLMRNCHKNSRKFHSLRMRAMPESCSLPFLFFISINPCNHPYVDDILLINGLESFLIRPYLEALSFRINMGR